MVATKEKPKMQRFRLMQGLHVEGRKNNRGPDGKFVTKPRKVYKAGDVVETESNLLALNGPDSRSIKFVLVGSPQDVQAQLTPASDTVTPNDPLDDMSIQDLRHLAAEEEVDLSGLSRKEEIAQAIRSAHT